MGADFRLGDSIVRPQRRIIERGDESIHVKPKSMSVFECLVAAGGEPVSRNDLFDMVWPGGEVSDDTLTKCIGELRKALGDTARESRVIETIPKLGFRVVLPAEPLAADQSSAESQQSRRGRWRKLRWPWLLLIALLLVFGVLLSFGSSRLWLTEAGITLFLKTAAILAPYGLEQKPGIAVLPFVNLSSDAENAYFSDGMSEEILNALASTNRLPVTARTSSFQFRGQNRDIREIGRLLGVTHLLEGSVRKVDKNIRVTVQLIDTTTGTHVWSEAYQRELSDIFVLQNEITKDIVDQIGVALGDKIAPPPNSMPTAEFMATHPTSNLEAYDLYLKGVQMVTSSNPGLIEQAEDYFDRAIALDRDYADAWAAKGKALYVLGRPGYGHSHIPASVYPDAIVAYRRALEIDPGHAFATGWLGATLIVNDYKWVEGMRLIKQSLDQNPNDAELLSVYAMYLDMMQMEGADEALDRAFRLDPFGILPIQIRAGRLLRAGRVLDAAPVLETWLIEDREGYAPNYHSAMLNLVIGRLDAARERFHKARLVANPVDLSLDAMEAVTDSLRGTGPMIPVAELMERMQTERLSFFVLRGRLGLWEDEKTIVAAFYIAIEQRDPDMRQLLFGPKPPMIPEEDWRRMKEVTGVTQFQLGRY